MNRKVFVSYKYQDRKVQALPNVSQFTWGRDYVDVLENKLKYEGHIYCGEKGDDDLSDKSDDYIYDHLKDKIFPTSCTVVLISKGMREEHKYDKSQWIPWEIYYSLREIPRENGTSHRNGIIGVVIPDENGSYDFAIKEKTCCGTGCTFYNRDWMFNILKRNTFNLKSAQKKQCNVGDTIWYGEASYIPFVKWNYFIENIDDCIERAERIRDNWKDYDLHIDVNA